MESLCEVIGVETLAKNEDYSTVEGRLENRKVLWEEVIVSPEFSAKELVEKMNSVGIPCGPINNIGEAFNDHHVKSLKMTKSATHPELGELSLLRSPITMLMLSKSPILKELGQNLEQIQRDS